MADNHQQQDEQQGFMQRWSQRKLEAQQQRASEEKDVQPPAETIQKTDADMPPIETLTEDSDFSGFLSPGVSEALRKQALRKLFHLPSMNVVDELDDYAEDFTSFASLGDIIPHDMKRMLEREKAKLQQQLEENNQQQGVELTNDTVDEQQQEHITSMHTGMETTACSENEQAEQLQDDVSQLEV